MRYLLDASSIYKIIELNKLDIVKSSVTLDIARYELGNAVLKDHTTHKTIDIEKAGKLIDFIYEILNIIENVSLPDGKGIIKTAFNLQLSFYDAAYVHYSKAANLVLVTEDIKLLKRVKGYIKVIKTEELLNEL